MRARGTHGDAGMKEPRKSQSSKSLPKPEEKLDEELEESAIRRPTRRPPPADPNGRRSIPSLVSRRDGIDPGRGEARSRCLLAATGVPRRRAQSSASKKGLPLIREGGSMILMGRQWARPGQ